MGQIFCKDCCENGIESSRKNAVTWGESTEDFFTDATSLHSSPSSIVDPKRSKRIHNKKRNVALHAEFRVHQDIDILAPPLCCETIMEATDNVFAGQDLGVDTLHNGHSALGSTHTLHSSGESSHEKTDASSLVLPTQAHVDEHQFVKHEKTPEEDSFLDEALSDEDNIVFEMVPENLRQMLKDYLERITVSKNTLLIRKGDQPDYLYLIFEGEVSVYIDPAEYMDENAMDIGKHAPMDISLGRRTSTSNSSTSTGVETTKREFKQSYVLNLRKSLFGSTYNESSTNSSSTGLLGRVFNLGQSGFNESRMSDVSRNTSLGVLLEDASASVNEDEEASFNLYKDLKGLKHERDLGPLDVFGELALIYNCPRTASCVTTTSCVLYRIDGEAFRRILSSSNTARNQKRFTESKAATEALYNLGIVEELDEQTLKDFGNALSPVVFKKGDLVITKGQYNDLMIFVMSGKLLVHDCKVGDSAKENLVLTEGGHFGESELLFGFPSYANVTVLSPKARLMAISKKDYRRRRDTLEAVMKRLWCRNTLLQIPVIAKSKLMSHEINGLVNEMKPISFPKGKINLTNEMKAAIFVVLSGKIQLSITDDGDGVVHSFGPSDHWGGRALFNQNFYEHKNSRSVELRCVFPSECMILTKSAITGVIGSLNRLGIPSVPEARKMKRNMKPSDLHFHRIIGVGMFGKVWLVQHKIARDVYALKVMEKKVIVGRKMIKGVIREKNVMTSVDHPFIVDLVSTFQDEHKLYMLESYVQGGELFGLIYNVSKKGYLSNDAAAFYGACLVEAISHLHSRNICHRDLKPENILINSDGYVVLVDFGFAKVVHDITYTTCGSPEYMAAEILLGKGHSWSVDHWALGVVIYEMLVGQTPFIHVGATRMTLFKRICNGVFAFPNLKKHGMDVQQDAKMLIKGLLNRNPRERMGSSITLGDEEIMTHPWFQGLLTDFHKALLAQKISPPWLPDIDDELDTSYFGSHEEAEKASVSKRDILDKKTQRLFSGF